MNNPIHGTLEATFRGAFHFSRRTHSACAKGIFSKPTLTERLIANAPNLDIHIIPDASSNGNSHAKKRKAPVSVSMQDVAKSLLILLAATLVSILFDTLSLA